VEVTGHTCPSFFSSWYDRPLSAARADSRVAECNTASDLNKILSFVARLKQQQHSCSSNAVKVARARYIVDSNTVSFRTKPALHACYLAHRPDRSLALGKMLEIAHRGVCGQFFRSPWSHLHASKAATEEGVDGIPIFAQSPKIMMPSTQTISKSWGYQNATTQSRPDRKPSRHACSLFGVLTLGKKIE
jgi:hypothetical protein